MSATELRKLGAFGRQVKDEFSTIREIVLLDQIEETMDALAYETVKFQSMALMTDHFIESLQKCSTPDVQAFTALEALFVKCRDLVEKYHVTQIAQRQCAIEDSRLTSEDGIVDAYDALLQEIAELHNNMNSLAWIIGEHLAEAESALPGSFDSAEKLFEAMGV